MANIHISDPGFSRNQIGKMLAIDSTLVAFLQIFCYYHVKSNQKGLRVAYFLLFLWCRGSFIAVGAYEDSFALFSVSESSGSNIVDEVGVFILTCAFARYPSNFIFLFLSFLGKIGPLILLFCCMWIYEVVNQMLYVIIWARASIVSLIM